MPGRNNRNCGAAVQISLALPAPCDDELEYSMSVWCPELNLVGARYGGYSGERGADVGIKHGELELQIVDAGVWLPRGSAAIILGNLRSEHDLIIGSVYFWSCSLVQTVVRYTVNAEDV